MRLYGKYFMIHLKSAMQYKASFLMTAIGQFLVTFKVFLGVYFMMGRFGTIRGYSYSEVLLCFAAMLLEFTLAEMFARGFDSFSSIISNGEFDRIMVRPRNEIFQILGARIELTRISRMLMAVVMFVYAIKTCSIEWSASKVITVFFMIIGGVLLFSGLFLIYASICFFTIEGLEFMNIFTDGAMEYGKYPIGAYGKRVLQICTFVIPYALVQFYPCMYILGRVSYIGYMFLPLLGGLFIVPCYGLWRLGVRHYKSTGS